MTEQREWDDAAMLDRLVDGELNDRQYRELLLRLETQPDGWRRCALAFLEAQAWRREMRTLRVEENLEETRADESCALARRRRFAEWLLAVAAGFLIAWSLGPLLSRDALTWPAGVERGSNQVAPGSWLTRDALPASHPISSAASVAPSASAGAETTDEENVLQIAGLPEPSDLDSEDAETEIVRDADGRAWEIPVDDWSSQHAQWLSEETSAFPAELARALENLGARIRRHRGLLPLETRDGRHVVVPVERVEITPVSFAQYR
ncbi:MAG: hypothetical protein KJ000_03240 [Pirellulaceae bacterium]|nr:hypothetical protein [Pirellulaceae bacterium]